MGAHRTAVLGLLALLAGCRADLVSDVDEEQANAILIALAGSGIDATKDAVAGAGAGATRHRVTVAPGDLAPGLAVLRARSLPRPEAPGLDDVFDGDALVPTPTEERARLAAAYAGELATTLETLPGVLRARVHVALPRPPRIGRDTAERTGGAASVLLLVSATRADPQDPGFGDGDVRRLVAGAVDGIAPESVVVVRVPGPAPPVAGGAVVLEEIGPLRVTAGTAPVTRLVLGGAFGLLMLVTGTLVFTFRRHRRQVSRLEDALAEAELAAEPTTGPRPPP